MWGGVWLVCTIECLLALAVQTIPVDRIRTTLSLSLCVCGQMNNNMKLHIPLRHVFVETPTNDA